MAGIGHFLYKRGKNMHREIQIKQFPIVTTHWWPKTRNERFVWENEQYLYSFLPLVHNHVQVIWVRTRYPFNDNYNLKIVLNLKE